MRSPTLALLTGLFVIAAGCASAAAILNGAAGYINELLSAPRSLVILGLNLALGILAAWGIRESVIAASVLTLIEIAGVMLVIVVAWPDTADVMQRLAVVPPLDGNACYGIFLGALLAFYAFIGFEDMVNVAEEVKAVERTLPRAIILTLLITTLLYLALATVSVLAVPPEELAMSEAPMALIFARGSGGSPLIIVVISLFALLNGALIQVIMASRVLYGLSTRRWLHPALAKVHPGTQTPLVATGMISAIILALALWFPLEPLAQATSLITLTIFAVVNLALWQIKRRNPRAAGIIAFPIWIPAIGFVVSMVFVVAAATQLAR